MNSHLIPNQLLVLSFKLVHSLSSPKLSRLRSGILLVKKDFVVFLCKCGGVICVKPVNLKKSEELGEERGDLQVWFLIMKRKGRTCRGNDHSEDNSPASKKKKCRKLPQVKLKDRSVFMDNEKTEGGRVKMGCDVIKTYWVKVDKGKGKRPKAPNINCRVETLGAIISEFGVVERQWVVEMGLGGLLFLAGKRQPRMLCYWLLTKLDPIRRLLVVSDNRRYQLLPQSVHWVLGLPCGGKKVPEVADKVGEQEIVDSAFEKYGEFTSEGHRCISMKKVLPFVIKKHNKEDNSNEFKLAFLIFVLGEFISPSTCSKLSHKLWPALTVFDAADQYDWCGFLLENLMSAGRLFCQNFYRDGYAKGCGGCTYFLAIFYMDHLDREPVGWGVFPRIKAWSNEAVNNVKAEDRLCDDDGEIIVNGDFGQLGCLNVAYGEQHPLGGRDTMGPTILNAEVARAVLSAVESAVGVGAGQPGRGVEIDPTEVIPGNNVVKRRLGPAEKANPRSRMPAREEEPQPVERTVVDEPVVEDEFSSDDDDTQPQPEGPPSQRNAGDILSGIEFSQDDFGAALNNLPILNQSQNISSDSLFRSLFNDFVVGGDGNEDRVDKDDAHDLGDGVVDNCGVNKLATNSEKDSYTRMNQSDGAAKLFCQGEEVGGEKVVHLAANGDKESDGVNANKEGGVDEGEERNTCMQETVSDSCSQKALSPPQKSRPKRGKRTTQKKEFIVEPLPRSNPNSRPRLTRFVLTTGALIEDSKNCRGIEQRNIFDLNIPMLQCDGMYADVMNCYSVVSPHCSGMDDNYIRTAGKLYTKMWMGKYEGRGVRYLMDPTFAMRIQQERGPPKTWTKTLNLCTSYAKRFPGCNADSFNVIFVPILKKSHWWCIGVSVNTQSVWVIDSMSLRRGLRDKQLLKKVLTGVELFFRALSQEHTPPSILEWEWKQVKMETQSDGNSCGARMLLAIKACAERFHPEFVLRSPIEEEREWLLNDDVMNPLNELKDRVRKSIEEHLTQVS